MITFSHDQKETQIAIAKRANKVASKAGFSYTRTDALMDISATHAICPLRLSDLLEANDFNFKHDVFGIRRHLNRETGELEDCFLPRYSA